ncbi:tRNA (adenine(58)-N(1))-methyltransferase, mitochondrial [Ambystoma mexicanum]|uniref:tRNA (adenine(58)-N(1))-methyltransferase, mitochondrial n=1 Tax=Ambystoma mexicanum TaxID=8296 RepID=UPI0037E83DDD
MLQCGRRLSPETLCRALLLQGAALGLPVGGESLHRLTGAFFSSSRQDSNGRSNGAGGGGGSSDEPAAFTPAPSLQGHRRRRRALSPLERLSRLIPAELLSEEVTALSTHGANTSIISLNLQTAPGHPENEVSKEQSAISNPPRASVHIPVDEDTHSMPCDPCTRGDESLDPHSFQSSTQPSINQSNSQPLPERTPLTVDDGHMDFGSISISSRLKPSTEEAHMSSNIITQPAPVNSAVYPESTTAEERLDCTSVAGQGSVFKVGDLCLAEYHKKYYLEFKKMFTLTETSKLLCNWGMISHQEIHGKVPGQMLKTSTGFPLMFRRPSLDEYVLLMKRGPTISYPKDSHAMLSMMDVSPGDTLLEAGSGSGGMSLFLSRAAGVEGRVLSFEVRSDHLHIAKRNYQRWRDAWEIGRGVKWPDNVTFFNKDLCSAEEEISSLLFDAVALDMVKPHLVLPVVYPHLKSGGVCAVYLANITQVIDMLEGIRICQLSLLCEKVTEVIHKDWLVVPSRQKDGSITKRMGPKQSADGECPNHASSDNEARETEESVLEDGLPFGSVPYIARPLPWQTGHTAFLVKLRKFKPASTIPVPKDKLLKEKEIP